MSSITNKPIDVKVALIGSADTGKTSLVKFLKGFNFENDDLERLRYNETWGVSVNVIEWDYESIKESNLPNARLRFGFWESGGSFLKKFPFYNQYLIKNAQIVIYMISL